MPVVVDTIQPLSAATTVALSSNPSEQPDSTTSTQLELDVAQKVAAEHQNALRARETSASAAVLGACMPESHYLNGQDKMVQFAGLYVVRGPTEAKHVRYTMDVAVAELQLRGRCIQRFQSFFLLRRRLLEVLKTCRGRLPVRRSTVVGIGDEPQISAGAELVELLTRPRCIQCPECESTHQQLSAVKFPRRTLFPPSLQDVQERSQALEIFLDYCVRIATTWPACRRSERLFTATLGKFLGVDLRAHIASQKEVGSFSEVRAVVNVINKEEDEDEQPESTEDLAYLPSPHEVAEDSVNTSDDFEDDRNSEPNFSFISNPSKEGNKDATLVRSQSHG
ncbi:Phox homologous domain [Phytophthora cinnamomi]|uniref:Phox homologous domain n=1 Tax=Phytophthora cinnamomi TaxID=4785 RepID=UPI00355A31C3|nr:Phox homologous domain [Phytophthora cinnamomi]